MLWIECCRFSLAFGTASVEMWVVRPDSEYIIVTLLSTLCVLSHGSAEPVVDRCAGWELGADDIMPCDIERVLELCSTCIRQGRRHEHLDGFWFQEPGVVGDEGGEEFGIVYSVYACFECMER